MTCRQGCRQKVRAQRAACPSLKFQLRCAQALKLHSRRAAFRTFIMSLDLIDEDDTSRVSAMVVRRFTDEMEPVTELESNTQETQRAIDRNPERSERRRFDYLYETAGENPRFVRALSSPLQILTVQAILSHWTKLAKFCFVLGMGRLRQCQMVQSKHQSFESARERMHDKRRQKHICHR